MARLVPEKDMLCYKISSLQESSIIQSKQETYYFTNLIFIPLNRLAYLGFLTNAG